MTKKLDKTEQRVIQAAANTLHHQQYVSPIDVFMGMGMLHARQVDDWRKGKVRCLENLIQGNLGKLTKIMKCFRKWAIQQGLHPSETAYMGHGRGQKKKLQFSVSAIPTIEEAYRTHYISPQLTKQKQQQLKEKLDKPPELVVFILVSDSQCSQCKEELYKGNLLYKEANDVFCIKCAGFDHIEFLQCGDAKLTRRAKKYSSTAIVVVKFSQARKRYERQGLLVETSALQQAQDEM